MQENYSTSVYSDKFVMNCHNNILTFDDTKVVSDNIFTITGVKKYMETLFNVVVINKEREVLIDEKVVAKNEEYAKFSANVYDYLKTNELTLQDVSIICYKLGVVEVEDYLK